MAGNVYVKTGGTWKQAIAIYVKTGGVWKSPTALQVVTGGVSKQVYPASVGSVSYVNPGSYTFTVPVGKFSVNVSYPTVSGIVTTAYSVTPGQNITVTIGDFGAGSSFGSLSAPAFSFQTFSFSGNVDHVDYFSITAGSPSGGAVSNGGSAYNHQVAAASIGITLSEYSEGYHGDLYSDIYVNSVPNSTLINTTRIYGQYISGRYQYELVQQQPTASNGFTYIVSPYDPGRSEGYYNYNIYLQQQVSMTVSW